MIFSLFCNMFGIWGVGPGFCDRTLAIERRKKTAEKHFFLYKNLDKKIYFFFFDIPSCYAKIWGLGEKLSSWMSPKWVKIRRRGRKKKKKKKVGENNGQLRFVRHHGWRTQARLDQFKFRFFASKMELVMKFIYHEEKI